jgi:single-stranded-DNA-specific exonuclease
MVEKYYKPSIMMATVDGVAKGSARSIPGFDIYQALKRCEGAIIQFGGHKYAAGLTVDLARFDEFSSGFKTAVGEMMSDELRKPAIRIDTEISLGELTGRFVRILREFAPFGPGNARPTFLARNVELTGTRPRIVGRNHLRFRVRQNGMVFDAIGFGLGHLLGEATQSAGRTLECVFSIDETDAGIPGGSGTNDTIPQLKVKDLRSQPA